MTAELVRLHFAQSIWIPTMSRDFLLCLATLFVIGCESPTVPSAAIANNPLQGRIVDLTHPFDADTIYWPTEKGFQFERGNNGQTSKGYYYAANRFTTAEHGGTHLDAPIHFAEGKQTADNVPIDRLVGEAVVIDVTAACAEDADYQIGVTELRSWEERHQRQFVDVIVLLKTGVTVHTLA